MEKTTLRKQIEARIADLREQLNHYKRKGINYSKMFDLKKAIRSNEELLKDLN